MNLFLFAETTTGLSWGDIATQVPLVVLALAVAWAFYKEWYVPGPTHKREVNRSESVRDENLRLRETLEEKVLPALIRSTDLTEEAVRVLDSAVDMLGQTSDALELLQDLHEETIRLHSDTRLMHERVVSALREWE